LLKIKDKIIDEYKNGLTIEELRKKYKCRHPFISKLLKTNNIVIQKGRNQFCKKIYLFDINGKVIKKWNNAGECSLELHIDRSNIRQCALKNTKENNLYFSANGYSFKYDKETPKDMFEITEIATNKIIRFKTKTSLTKYFCGLFPNKKIIFSQLVRKRKTMYGYTIKKLYEHRN